MATEKRLIDANALLEHFKFRISSESLASHSIYLQTISDCVEIARRIISEAPTVKAYTAHEVAEILADVFTDSCACNFNGNDEWLPEKCELLSSCPNPDGVACWEQFLKYRDGERKDNA